MNGLASLSRTTLLVLALSIQPAKALTATCDVSSLPPPVDMAVNHPVAGKYQDFISVANKHIGAARDSTKFIEAIAQAFPAGFKNCAVIKTDEITGRYTKGIVSFQGDDGRLVFFKYAGIRHADDWTIAHYIVTSNFSEVLETWE